MTFSDYIAQALRSETPKTVLVGDAPGMAFIVEIIVAAAHLADLLKKQVIYGRQVSDGEFREKLDDIRCAVETAQAHKFAPSIQHTTMPWQPRLTHAALGLFGETGELLEALLEDAEGGIDLDPVNVVEEVGDSAWYIALALDELDRSLASTPERTLLVNIEKLKKRYPERFTLEQSENRDIAGERQAMEGVVP